MESQASSLSGSFSVADIPFDSRTGFQTYEDSKWKIAMLMEAMMVSPESMLSVDKGVIFNRALDINKELSPQVYTEDLINIYQSVVIYRQSYTRVTQEELDTTNTGGVSRSIPFSKLMEQEYPKARYSLEPFFEQGTVNMISAPPNSWKSWLMFLCAIHISEGSELFTKFPTEKTKVMIVNEEDSFRSIQDRFRILNITNTELPIFFRVSNGSKLESKFVNSLLEEIKEKQIGIVMFDSLRSMHEADENDSTAMQKILDQMKKIAREGVTVVFTHHHRKKGMFEKSSTAESSRGSSAINAAISGHISLDEEERETGLYLVVRHLKSKAGEKLPPFEIKIMKEEGKVEFHYDGEFKASEKKLKNTKNQMMEILNDGKWKTMKDFEMIESGKDIKRNALQSLKNDGMVLSITRKQAIEKSIPVTAKGRHNELYYSLNSESAELATRTDTEEANQDFLNY